MRHRILVVAIVIAAFSEVLSAEAQELAVVFGPETFVRTTAKPVIETRTISTAGFQAPFVLTIRNGNPDGSDRVASGIIKVDGVQILGTSDFSKQFPGAEVEIAAGETVELAVELRGVPGSFVVFTLEAAPAVTTRFCPAEVGDGVSFGDFSSAIAATDPGGTIVVCDGTHMLRAVNVSKPLTIRAEHPGAATLTAPSYAVFIITNVSSGTNVFRDLNFSIAGGIALTFGNPISAPVLNFDQVIVEHCTFTPTATFPGGIHVSPSAVPGAKVTVRYNRFIGGSIAVRGSGSIEFHDNECIGQTFVPATFTGGRSVVRDNTFIDCRFACVRVYQPAEASVTGNTIEVPVGGESRIGVEVGGASGPVSVTGNSIRGVGTVVDRSNPAHYAFQDAAIMTDDGLLPLIEISGNTIRGAAQGIVAGSSAFGSNNVIDHVHIGFRNLVTPSAFHRCDVTDYVYAIAALGGNPYGDGTLTCNWWGSASGPIGYMPYPWLILPAVYTPFSTVPIANQPSVVCP